MNALIHAAPPRVNATRFRSAHEAQWARLNDIVTRIERRSLRTLSDDDLLALPLLYRSSLSSLSVARETSLDRALVTYLEQLCTRAYFQIYGVPVPATRQIGEFFARRWPLAVQALWRETLVTIGLTVVSAIVGYLLVIGDPSWFYGIIPDALADGRDPSASAAALRETLYAQQNDMLATFAAYLFQHNSQVAIFAFALGFAFGVPAVLLIIYNGLSLGAMLAVFVPKGLGVGFAGWLTIHGTTELFAICLAGAAGLRIGQSIAFPGRLARTEAAVVAGREAATVMVGVIIMLLIAGLLEGIGRQTVLGDGARYIVGLTVLSGWLVYFYVTRRRDALAVPA